MKINYWFNRDRQGQFDSFRMKVRRFVRSLIRATAVVSVLTLSFTLGAATFSTSSSATSYSTVQAVESPVLDRIADCESGDGTKGSATHYGKSGQVLMRPNTNGTVDLGKYQINTVWFKTAADLGYDLTKEEDNEAFAEWLYLNKGTEDWYSSKKCWYHN